MFDMKMQRTHVVEVKTPSQNYVKGQLDGPRGQKPNEGGVRKERFREDPLEEIDDPNVG